MVIRYTKGTNNSIASRKYSISGANMWWWRKDKTRVLGVVSSEKYFVDLNWTTMKIGGWAEGTFVLKNCT